MTESENERLQAEVKQLTEDNQKWSVILGATASWPDLLARAEILGAREMAQIMCKSEEKASLFAYNIDENVERLMKTWDKQRGNENSLR